MEEKKFYYPDRFHSADGFEFRRLQKPIVFDGMEYHWIFKPISHHKEWKKMDERDKRWDYCTNEQLQEWRVAIHQALQTKRSQK